MFRSLRFSALTAHTAIVKFGCTWSHVFRCDESCSGFSECVRSPPLYDRSVLVQLRRRPSAPALLRLRVPKGLQLRLHPLSARRGPDGRLLAASQTKYPPSPGPDSAPHSGFNPGKLVKCFDDIGPRLQPRSVGSNNGDLNVEKCAASCSPGDRYCAIDSGEWLSQAPIASQCRWYGAAPPAEVRVVPANHCGAGYSKTRSERCVVGV